MPIFDNDTTAGKCPICLQDSPCVCVFNGNVDIPLDTCELGINFRTSENMTAIELLTDIKNELANIKNLLQSKALKEDLEEIIKVHNG